jgi:sigma54-dependent transcription regulator
MLIMTTKAQQAKEEFLCPTPPMNPDADMTFLDIATINNLNNFSHHVSYLTNMAVGGKITADLAYQEIKKLYKAMKESHKSLKGSWF